jgi:Ca2+-binding RTX toxin-like protein
VVTDFAVGNNGDLLDVYNLVPFTTYTGGNSFDQGYFRLFQSGADTLFQWDRDSASGNGYGWQTVITLQGVLATSVTSDNFVGKIIIGTEGNDNLVGEWTNDQVFGLGGNDTLDGAAGDNLIDGGIGSDIAILSGYAADYRVSILSAGQDGRTYYDLGFGLQPGDIVNLASTTGRLDRLVGVERVKFLGDPNTDADDVIIDLTPQAFLSTAGINYGQNYFADSNAQNLLTGGAGADVLDGLTGNDSLVGGGGNDILLGGDGDDTLEGGDGNDALNGQAGDDSLVGGSGNDNYILDSLNDVVVESAGDTGDRITSMLDTFSIAGFGEIEVLEYGNTGNFYGIGNAKNNVLIGKSGNDTLEGGDGNDSLVGSSGNDRLDGGAGNDNLQGGTGNDTYIIDSTGDLVDETGGSGTDTVESSLSAYTLASSIENLILSGAGDINGTGSALNNQITGNSGNNILDGGTGNDTLIGGAGNDTYLVDNAGDVVTENSDEGTDLIQSSVSYALTANVENLTLTGSSGINATGNADANQLTGNTGNNILDGGSGNDTLLGGAGNDTYVVDSAEDVADETGGSGIDTVQTSLVNYTLGIGLDNLIFTTTGANTGIGNSLANRIAGNSGNDTLDGGTGIDTLVGGAGDDLYLIDNSLDQITENFNEGIDTVQTGLALTLGSNIENLILTGSNSINGAGNALDNQITGNSGNNILDGGSGNDTLIGGSGNDTYLVDSAGDVVTESSGEGTDLVQASVTCTLAANVENLTLTGAGNISGTGNGESNQITGNSGNNALAGGAGNDTLDGGAGNDVVEVSGLRTDYRFERSLTDIKIIHLGTGETDTLVNVERVHFSNGAEGLLTIQDLLANSSSTLADLFNGSTGDDSFDALAGNDTLYGNAGNDILFGNDGNDSITGGLGNDSLDGGAGNDTMLGGAGDDLYQVDIALDVITENALEGNDTVQASDSYVLSGNLENLILSGTSHLAGTGNSGNNQITGNSGNNILDGGAGNDTLLGGTGNDTYLVDSSADQITENTGEGVDLVLSSATCTLGANLENLTLTGAASINGTGNSENNQIAGNGANNQLTGLAGNDTLDGGIGNDTLIGGLGDDTYLVDVATDLVTELTGEGSDTVRSQASYLLTANLENLLLLGAALTGTGNALDNQMTGNALDNTLDGGVGADSLTGGAGNDIYIIDNAADVVTENNAEGTDTVRSLINWTLGANLENLLLTGAGDFAGSGNALNNRVTGNAGNNTLDGGAGNDTLIGGVGNDTYLLDSPGDIVTEMANEGIDTVIADASATLGANVERLVLNGSGNHTGTGNELNNLITGNSGNNILYGGLGNDTLSGGPGNDTLIGALGNDTYLIGDQPAQIIEAANEGTDTVRSQIDCILAANLENLTLLGAAINGTGNALDNRLLGNAHNNFLSGGAGNDTLEGGSGDDTLAGGTGDDTYTQDNLGDVITELAGEGNDTLIITATSGTPIIYTAPDNIETVRLGEGSTNIALATNGTTQVAATTGIDSVVFTGGGSMTLGAGVENLALSQATGNIGGTGGADNNLLEGNNGANMLDGGAGNDTLKGYAGADILLGGIGNDRLDGGKGADRMEGGSGDDIYTVDNANDQIVEAAASGNDTVRSWLKNTTLGDNLENLILEGTAKANGTGNDLANSITGNVKANILTGGAGADTFVFNTALGPMNVDTITDFTTGSDKIALDHTIFGTLSGGWFHSVTSLAQTDADDHILYDQSTGALYYDADASGGGAAVRFAMVSGMPAVSAADLQIV